jgi:hypothetical protein
MGFVATMIRTRFDGRSRARRQSTRHGRDPFRRGADFQAYYDGTEGNLRADRGWADRARSIIRRPEQQGREFDRILRRWQNQTPLPRQRPP